MLAATLGLTGVAWIVAVRQMDGMDMGVATPLGSFASFTVLWVAMMAAMMLPGAVPNALARAQDGVRAVPRFLGSYLAVWTLVGIGAYAVDRPHGTTAAGVIAIAAGAYEVTPLKRQLRRRCRADVGSGLAFGRLCVGSSIGLMLVLLAVGVMSIAWMAVIAVVVVAQKLLPPNLALDVPLALALVVLGVLILTTPASVPGLVPAM